MWILFVWIVSAICYLPLYFEKSGYATPNVLIQMKYLFVIVPVIFALIYVRRRTSIKKWFRELFVHKIEIEAFVLCGLIAFCGILCTCIWDKVEWNVISLLFNVLYLLCMAALEEIAWRGFYLESMMQKKTKRIAVWIVSAEWAVWHIPMWMIRNSLGLNDVIFWLIYTTLVGNILGICMMRYKNIFVPIMLHTIFNVCFLMPIQIGMITVLCVWLGILVYFYMADRTDHNGN